MIHQWAIQPKKFKENGWRMLALTTKGICATLPNKIKANNKVVNEIACQIYVIGYQTNIKCRFFEILLLFYNNA